MSDDHLNIMEIAASHGTLEASLATATHEKTITAVLCHPHPQYGGNMHDAVLATVVEVLNARGVNCLRFNFRGVGRSTGRYDGGSGEVEDLHSVVDWVRQEYPRDKLWLAGYSFGAHVVWQALSNGESLGAERAIFIAPPSRHMTFSPSSATACTMDAFVGSADDFADAAQLATVFDPAAVHMIDGADHFFTAQHHVLAEQLAQCLDNHRAG